MALGEYRPPNQINKDEDKYWKLTKTQILYGILGMTVGMPVFLLAMSFGHFVITKIFAFLFVVILAGGGILSGGLTIKDSKYLEGGGLRLDKYLIRKFRKKFSKKSHVLYTKNIDRDKIVFYTPKTIDRTENSYWDDLLSLFKG